RPPLALVVPVPFMLPPLQVVSPPMLRVPPPDSVPLLSENAPLIVEVPPSESVPPESVTESPAAEASKVPLTVSKRADTDRLLPPPRVRLWTVSVAPVLCVTAMPAPMETSSLVPGRPPVPVPPLQLAAVSQSPAAPPTQVAVGTVRLSRTSRVGRKRGRCL